MTQSSPQAPFEPTTDIIELCYDQCDMWKGCSNKHGSRAMERVDEDGKRIGVEKITIVNILEFVIPKQFTFTAAERAHLLNGNGIYELPFDVIIPHHNYTSCRAWLSEAWSQNSAIFLGAFEDGEDDPISAGLYLIHRPDYTTEPTFYSLPNPLFDCDTKAHKDTARILKHATTRKIEVHEDEDFTVKHYRPLCVRLIGDGQTVLNCKNAVRLNPDKYNGVVVDAADMHAEGHSTYAGHGLFYMALLESCANAVQRRHILPHPTDLEEDKFNHRGNNR